MRSLTLTVPVPMCAESAYDRLCDFGSYMAVSPFVRSVTVSTDQAGSAVSRWEVNFRNGVLRWSERDVFDRAQWRIEFEQFEGDLEVFRGSWQCSPHVDGCEVVFSVEFDLGIPTLAEALEPIAVLALQENTFALLAGLFGPEVAVPADRTAIPAQPAERPCDGEREDVFVRAARAASPAESRQGVRGT